MLFLFCLGSNFLNPNSFFCPFISQGIISSFLPKHECFSVREFSATGPSTCRCGGMCVVVWFTKHGKLLLNNWRGWRGTSHKQASGLQSPPYDSELPQEKTPTHKWTDEGLDAKAWTNKYTDQFPTLHQSIVWESLRIFPLNSALYFIWQIPHLFQLSLSIPNVLTLHFNTCWNALEIWL